MNDATDTLHTTVANYEPSYLLLMAAVDGYLGDEMSLQDARDMLADWMERNHDAMHLSYEDVADTEVDYSAMILFEADV